jgi:heme a synthase
MTKPTQYPSRRIHIVSPAFTLMVSVSILLVFIVVVLSAYLRLGDMGVGCTDWPECFGKLGATSDGEAGKSLAEGGPLLPPSFARTFHRVAAALLGFIVLGITYLALRHRSKGGPGVLLPLLVLAITIFLSVLGYITPSPLVPAVAVANIAGGMAMLAMLWWIGQRSVRDDATGDPMAARLKPWARLALVILAAQIVLGAWTSGSFAGPSCPKLSGCEQWWSADAVARGFNPLRKIALEDQGKVVVDTSMRAVHMGHRLGALLTVLYLGWLGFKARATSLSLRATGVALLALLALQAALGIGAVTAQLPLALVTLHNAGAALLLLAVTNLNHRVTLEPTG